jgi:hypothetical protein
MIEVCHVTQDRGMGKEGKIINFGISHLWKFGILSSRMTIFARELLNVKSLILI